MTHDRRALLASSSRHPARGHRQVVRRVKQRVAVASRMSLTGCLTRSTSVVLVTLSRGLYSRAAEGKQGGNETPSDNKLPKYLEIETQVTFERALVRATIFGHHALERRERKSEDSLVTAGAPLEVCRTSARVRKRWSECAHLRTTSTASS